MEAYFSTSLYLTQGVCVVVRIESQVVPILWRITAEIPKVRAVSASAIISRIAACQLMTPLRTLPKECRNHSMSDEWRTKMLETLPYLHGQSFILKPYKAYRANWEHDHCAVCGVKLMEAGAEGENLLHEGYATTSDYLHGEDYEWVCAECFAASKDAMHWRDATAT